MKKILLSMTKADNGFYSVNPHFSNDEVETIVTREGALDALEEALRLIQQTEKAEAERGKIYEKLRQKKVLN